MELLSTAQYESFLEAYRKLESKRLEEEISGTTTLFENYSELSQKLAPILAKEAPYFNIFKILNISHYEAWVHTPFLGNLLDPNGSHMQGKLFLDSFFKMVLKIDIDFLKVSRFEIHEEFPIANGRIDLLILYTYTGETCGIIIENKIYAQDQKLQLFRYYDYLKSTLKITKENSHIVYLSPWTTQPSEDSLGVNTLDKAEVRSRLKTIGYKQHIIPWLMSISENILSNTVKHIVHQYIKTLNSL